MKLTHFLTTKFFLLTLLTLFLFCVGVFGTNLVLGTAKPTNATFWNYQCIDTMKSSRDMARSMMGSTGAQNQITTQIVAIKNLGANCVAIDTPYDSEFLPILTLWVTTARQYNLHIWFRGNFSSWEGWFDYPTNMTTLQNLQDTKSFILRNPQLFQDGDIFTEAPEAENGGPFLNKESSSIAPYRQFLIDEYQNENDAFSQIHKSIVTNWFSMSGGWAKAVLDKPTIDAIGDNVTIDHYVKSPSEMCDYISYFNNTFHSKVTLGEFGAPIPDINGDMTDAQQADFVSKLFTCLYHDKNDISGINYWDIMYGSTALLSDNGAAKPVDQVIKNYYLPYVVNGKVNNVLGEGIANATVTSQDGLNSTQTNQNGDFELPVARNTQSISVTSPNYFNQEASVISNNAAPMQITMKRQTNDFWYNLDQFFHHLF